MAVGPARQLISWRGVVFWSPTDWEAGSPGNVSRSHEESAGKPGRDMGFAYPFVSVAFASTGEDFRIPSRPSPGQTCVRSSYAHGASAVLANRPCECRPNARST